ncbi:unnamed protein product [Cercospora beticola]|nr:unnamed protein product [Cercospora beticola]
MDSLYCLASRGISFALLFPHIIILFRIRDLRFPMWNVAKTRHYLVLASGPSRRTTATFTSIARRRLLQVLQKTMGAGGISMHVSIIALTPLPSVGNMGGRDLTAI